jgi:hypothetical protein
VSGCTCNRDFKDKEELLAHIREMTMHPLLADDAMGDEWDSKTVGAYYRGQESGIWGACMRVEEAMSGNMVGTIGSPKLQKLCEKIAKMAKAIDTNEKASK